MVALIKLIIVMVLAVFSGEPSKEYISDNTDHQVQYQYEKMDMLTRCDKSCIPS